MVTDIQAIVDHYGVAHTFAGWIQMQPDPGYGESTPQRYIVVDGRVEIVTPTLAWPGEQAGQDALVADGARNEIERLTREVEDLEEKLQDARWNAMGDDL